MDSNIIKKIIEAGNLAPSGGNSQPWKFIVKGDTIRVLALSHKDHPVLNFKDRGTLVAIGALIENIQIAAATQGLTADWKENLSKREIDITLKPSESSNLSGLAEVIRLRHTNRKDYKKEPLSESEKAFLLQELHKFPQCELVVIEKEKVRDASKHLAIDILMFLQNELLHKLLFEEILWKEDHQHTRGGLYIKTMEAIPPKSFVMKLMSNWKLAKFFGKLKLPNKIHEENANKIAASALIGVIVVEDNDENFIHAGRLLENIWLRSAKLGLSFQLVSGMLFLRQQMQFGQKYSFTPVEKQVVESAYQELVNVFGVKRNIMALAFRIGKSEKPLAVSHKRSPEISWE